MMTLSQMIQAAATKKRQRVSLFMYVPHPTAPLRLWSGPGAIVLPEADSWDPGARYIGGVLRRVPPMSALLNGKAERIEFTFSGAVGFMRDYVFDPAKSIKDCKMHLGLMWFGPDWQPLGPVGLFRTVTVDMPGYGETGTDIKITTSCITNCGRRKAQGLRTWTHANHRTRHPTDDLCRRVATLHYNYRLKWGPNG
jgi:hypothetical protein